MLRTALALVLAGCWTATGASSPVAPSSESAAAPPIVVVPKRMFAAQTRPRGPYLELAGKWIGHGVQYDNHSDWDITLEITSDPVPIGEEIGKVDYPGLACGGSLVRRPERPDGTLVAAEKITYGTRCVEGGSFELPPRATAESFNWKWFGADGKEEAEGSVRRRN